MIKLTSKQWLIPIYLQELIKVYLREHKAGEAKIRRTNRISIICHNNNLVTNEKYTFNERVHLNNRVEVF